MKFSDWSIKNKIAVPAILCFIAGTLAIVFGNYILDTPDTH